MSTRKKYSKEFKLDAVSLVLEQGYTRAEAARSLQIDPSLIRRWVKAHGIRGSMSRKGDCWDNAVVESFFGSLKQERVQWRNYQSRHEAQQDILGHISMFYNSKRLHSCLDYRSPNEFEQQLKVMKKRLNGLSQKA